MFIAHSSNNRAYFRWKSDAADKRVTVKMASGPVSPVRTLEGNATSNELRGNLRSEMRAINHIAPLEVVVGVEQEKRKSVDYLDHCHEDSYITVATTAREQVADILERGSCSPSRYSMCLLETSSSENIESQSSQAVQMEGYTKEGEFTPHASSLTVTTSHANFTHSELLPRAWKGKGETPSLCQASDSSVSDELQEVICFCMSW